MRFFRLKHVSNICTLLTGLIFLNMSFFLAEVTALKLDQNKEMMENIARLIAGVASEEEKDVFGSTAEKDNLTPSGLDLFLDGSHSAEYFLIPLSIALGTHCNEKPVVQFSETAYPPPKS